MLLHQLRELREEIVRIVRARRSFRMILDTEERKAFVAHPFIGMVVEIHVRDFHFARWQRFRVHAKPVILSSDFNFFIKQVLDRMIRTMMPEFQLEGFAPQREAAELVAEADTEDRNAAEKLLNILDGVADRLGVAGTIRKKNPVRLEIEDICGARLRRNNPNVAMVIDKQAQNILLDAKIVGRNTKFARIRNSARLAHRFRPRRNRQLDRAFFPAVSLFACNAARKFLPSHRGQLLGLKNQLFRGSAVSSNDPAKCSDVPNMANERARVDIPDGRYFVAIQVQLRGFRRAPVRRNLREFTHDERFNVRARRLLVVEIGADIPNMRVC